MPFTAIRAIRSHDHTESLAGTHITAGLTESMLEALRCRHPDDESYWSVRKCSSCSFLLATGKSSRFRFQ